MNARTEEEPLPEHVSIGQLAKAAGVHRKTICRRIQDGTLPAVRLGPQLVRIKREDALKLLSPTTSEDQHNAAPERD